MQGNSTTSGKCRHALCVATMLMLFSPLPGMADGWETGGHLKAQYTGTDYRNNDLATLFGEDPAHDLAIEGRLKAEWRARGWDTAIHYEVLALTGDSVVTRRALATAGLLTGGTTSGLPDDRHRLFDLTDDFIDETRTVAVHRLDRLAVGYTTGTATVRIGRQAVSWGNGLAFQVLDFVNPFSPLAIDKDYKTGEDMLYGQWLATPALDLQLLSLPRRDLQTGALDDEQASHAVKLHARAGANDLDALVARHHDQTLLGAGLVRSLGGAVWRMDVLHTAVPGRDGVWSLVTNLDYSWTWFDRNLYGFAEYFRNGFGVARDTDYAVLDPALQARLARGELYTIGRDSAALGLQIELAPLVNVFGTLIQNLNDSSRLVQWRVVWDLRQDLILLAGVSVPSGERGSEYGGIPVAILPGVTVAPGRAVFARIAYYF